MLVVANLVRNYSPHLGPDTKTAPPMVELRKVLVMAAEEMLESFLKRWRMKKKFEKGMVKGGEEKIKGKGKGRVVDPCFSVRVFVFVRY
jgi:hypothetical protein